MSLAELYFILSGKNEINSAQKRERRMTAYFLILISYLIYGCIFSSSEEFRMSQSYKFLRIFLAPCSKENLTGIISTCISTVDFPLVFGK